VVLGKPLPEGDENFEDYDPGRPVFRYQKQDGDGVWSDWSEWYSLPAGGNINLGRIEAPEPFDEYPPTQNRGKNSG